MAFEQILGRENFETVVEIREIHIQKDRKHNAEGKQGKSLAHNNNKVIRDKKREGELLHADRARTQDKEAEEATREREGEGKFEMKGDSERSRVEKERRNKEEEEEEEEARAEEVERSRLEAVNKYRAKAMQKRMDIIASTEQKAKQAAAAAAAASDDHQEKELEVKENTERKKEKSERKSSETKTESKEGASPKSFEREEQQEGIGKPGAVGQVPQKDTKIPHESKTVERFEGIQERDKGTKLFTTYADVVKGSVARKEEESYKDIAGSKGCDCDEGEKEETEDGGVVLQMEKNPLIDNNYFYPTDTEGGGRGVFGAVGETVKEIIVETVMKPAEKVMMQKGEEEEEGKGGGGGVLRAIGETVAEIAETTKGIVVREGKTESRQSTWSEAF